MNIEDKRESTSTSVKSTMAVITANTLREIVNTANSKGIRRENVVSLIKDNGQLHLVYFG